MWPVALLNVMLCCWHPTISCFDILLLQGSEQRAQVIACLNMQPMSSYSQVNEYGQPLMSREALAAGSPMKRARTNNSSPLTGLLQQHPLFLQQQLQQTHPLLLQSGLLPGGAPAAAAAAAAMAAAGMRTTPSFIPPALNLPGLPGLSLPAALQAQLQQQRQIAQAQLPQVAPPQQPLSQAPQLRAPNLNGLLTSMRFNMVSLRLHVPCNQPVTAWHHSVSIFGGRCS
ncbi:hypothetical protein V8C86DRAFT_1180609 [Haematococcus lacustris]